MNLSIDAKNIPLSEPWYNIWLSPTSPRLGIKLWTDRILNWMRPVIHPNPDLLVHDDTWHDMHVSRQSQHRATATVVQIHADPGAFSCHTSEPVSKSASKPVSKYVAVCKSDYKSVGTNKCWYYTDHLAMLSRRGTGDAVHGTMHACWIFAGVTGSELD